jgi:hypothetical protein
MTSFSARTSARLARVRVKGSFLKGFDLDTGDGKISAALPGTRTLCNDMALGPDGSVYVTNSFTPQIPGLSPSCRREESHGQIRSFNYRIRGSGHARAGSDNV